MKILFLSRWYPFPPNNGSKIRIYNLLRGLSKDHEISVLSFFSPMDRLAANGSLQNLCSEVDVVTWKPFNPNSLRSISGFFKPEPRSVIDTYSPKMARKIKDAINNNNFDLVIASQITMAGYVHHFKRIPAIWEEVETGVLYQQYAQENTFLGHIRNSLTWFKYRKYLTNLIHEFTACTVASTIEKKLLEQIAPDYTNIEVIPNFIQISDYEEYRSTAEPALFSLIFCGSFSYSPNYKGIQWFLKEVFPIILSQCPDARLTITGDPAGMELPSATNVDILGYVDDVRPHIANSWVSIAPILEGGGTRVKIVEAMALGTPVVSTSKGAEGLDVIPGDHLLIGDTPCDFANAIVRLFRNPSLYQNLAASAYQHILSTYDCDVIVPKFQGILEKVAVQKRDGINFCLGTDDR